MQVALLYEDGPGRGLGHRRRLEALGQELAELGVESALLPIGAEVESKVVVIDAYGERADHPRFSRPVAAIDDLERNLDVDLLVDPNPPGDPDRCTRATQRFLGFDYAMVRKTPALASRAIDADARRVLVTAGGTDLDGIGSLVAAAIVDLDPGLEVVLGAGPWSEVEVGGQIRVVRTSTGLLEEIAAADIVVCAGGVTLLESLMLGRPTIVLPTADNQMRAVAGVRAAAAAVCVERGSAVTEVAEAVVQLASDRRRRERLAGTATSLIDGRGPRRVAEAVRALV